MKPDRPFQFPAARRHAGLWLVLAALLAIVQFDAMHAALRSLGVSAGGASALLVASVLGSLVDVPIASIGGREGGRSEVALSVGGALVPICLSAWLGWRDAIPFTPVALAVGIVALASRFGSRVEPGVGVVMPGFVGPVAAAVAAVLLRPEHPGPLAYICGTLGVLVGADLTRLPEAVRDEPERLVIGGAGTRDGIFLAGIVAVMLA